MLPLVEYWYKTAHQSSAGMTPFRLLYIRDLPIVARYILGSSASEIIESYLLDRDEAITLLKAKMARAPNRMKGLGDKSQRELSVVPRKRGSNWHSILYKTKILTKTY